MTQGNLEAWSAAVGEAINDVAGFRFTRLTAQVAKGATTFPVETTFGWPAAGRVVVDKTAYAYSGKTGTTLTGVTWLDAGAVTSGAREQLEPGTHAVDFSRTFSAVDQVRNQVLVDTASDRYLSTLARNLGVTRPPNLTDDEAFRTVVKALAYLPRGTTYGIETALTSFFGAGNFRIYEDPTHRCTVFIQLLNGVAVATTPDGHAYLLRREVRPLDTGAKAVVLQGPSDTPPRPATWGDPIAVQGARLADEGRSDTLGATKPSALTEIRYSGDAGAFVWKFSGTDEVADTSASANTGLAISVPLGDRAAYFRTARIRPESRASLLVTAKITSSPSTVASSGKQFSLNIRDKSKDVAVGIVGQLVGPTYKAGFIDTSTGLFITDVVGPGFSANSGEWHDFEIRKYGSNYEFWADGIFAQAADESLFPASSVNEFRFGAQDVGYAMDVLVKHLAFSASTDTDFWNLTGTGGTLSSGSPDRLNTHSGAMLGTVGKAVRTVGALGGNAGQWLVGSVIDADVVVLTSPIRSSAFVETAHPDRITATLPGVFRYPQDVGKHIKLIKGGSPAAHTYLITAVLDAFTGAALTGTFPETSNKVQVAAISPANPPPFTTEVGFSWQLLPNFQTESSVPWTLVADGSFSGRTLTLPANPPLDVPGGYVIVMEATYATMDSAFAVSGEDIPNDPVGTQFPIYLPQSPFGPFVIFLKNLTAAGVVPEIITGAG